MDPPHQYVSDTAQVSNLGTKDIHLKRMTTSICLSMILQMLFLGLFIFTVNFDIFHPISWLMICLKISTSFNIVLKLALLSAVVFIQGEICKINYVNGPICHITRFLKMKRLFSVKNLLLLVFHIATGFAIFWIYSSLLGGEYESLTRQCTDTYNDNLADYCIEERKLFLLLGGVWSGIYFFIIDYSFGFQFLSFPLIQQLKIYRVKAALLGNVKRSMKDSITPLMIFIFLYYLYGGYIRRKLMNFLTVGLDSEPMDSLKILTNIKPMFFLWLFSSIFVISLQMMKILFNVYLTEHCTFPVSTSMLPQENYISLVDALKPTSAPIVQHLGFLDLFTLSTKHQERREQLFTLSHPGGHPHSWNGIYCESVNLIQKFTNDLNSALQQGSDSLKKPEKTSGKVEDLTAFHIHSHGIRTLASPTFNDRSSQKVEDVTGIYIHSHGMRKLASPVCQKSKPPTSFIEITFNNFQSWWNVKLSEIGKKPYIAYFFANSSDSRINYLLFQSQPVIWAVQSLAFMASASLTEDRYGIVQRDLSDIIIALLDLKVTLDKLFKQNLIVKKTFANDPLDVQMKFRLRTAVKRSLYRLAVSFGPYIKDLKLSTDAKLQMNNFIAFKELL